MALPSFVLSCAPVFRWSLAALALCASSALQAQEENPCGPLSQGHYGPFDYRSAHESQRSIVENAHFRPETYSRLQGITGPAGGDINYTLRAFPNHPKALDAMMRLGEKEKTTQPRNAMYTVECYFERAIRFRNDDLIVRMLYANFLLRQKDRTAEAVKQLEFVTAHAADNPFTHFNAGLLLADAKAWPQALVQAHRALELGFPRTALKERLQAAGQWREPEPVKAAENAAAETAAPAASAPGSAPGSAPAP
jgi:hypothetical protein